MKPQRVHINTTLALDLKSKADTHGIKYAEALRVGIAVLLLEHADAQYANGLNIYRKMLQYKQMFEEMSEKMSLLDKKTEKNNI